MTEPTATDRGSTGDGLDYEDVTSFDLDADDEQRLLDAHNECTFIRARVSAVRRDPRVCIVVTSTGSPLPRNKAVTWKGTCTVREDPETKAWFYPALAEALMGPGTVADRFVSFLDSPRRIIFEVEPTQRIGYDGAKMQTATTAWLKAQRP